MSVPEFIDEFIIGSCPVEVSLYNGPKYLITYVGGENNWEAFKKHISGFKNTRVFCVGVVDGKLSIEAEVKA